MTDLKTNNNKQKNTLSLKLSCFIFCLSIFVYPFCQMLPVVRSLKLKYYIQTKILLCSWVLRVSISEMREREVHVVTKHGNCLKTQIWY